MSRITFIGLAEMVLGEEQRPLSPEEIWEIARDRGHDQLVGSEGKTPWKTIAAQLYVDVRDNPNSIFAKTNTRPRRFYLRSFASKFKEDELGPEVVAISEKPILGYVEKDLHPFLVYYGFNFLRAYLKTIEHSRSKKTEFGEWVHPDLVGCYFAFTDWNDEVVEVSSAIGNVALKFYSFELKRGLTFGNLREAFFQAVSNSSWANEGYLAAAEISNDEDLLGELQRLSSSFGVGIIRIDIEDPDSTEVLIPARLKEAIDWETVNKLASLNRDFSEFLTRVKNDLNSREIRREKYDQIHDRDYLLRWTERQGERAQGP